MHIDKTLNKVYKQKKSKKVIKLSRKIKRRSHLRGKGDERVYY